MALAEDDEGREIGSGIFPPGRNPHPELELAWPTTGTGQTYQLELEGVTSSLAMCMYMNKWGFISDSSS